MPPYPGEEVAYHSVENYSQKKYPDPDDSSTDIGILSIPEISEHKVAPTLGYKMLSIPELSKELGHTKKKKSPIPGHLGKSPTMPYISSVICSACCCFVIFT